MEVMVQTKKQQLFTVMSVFVSQSDTITSLYHSLMLLLPRALYYSKMTASLTEEEVSSLGPEGHGAPGQLAEEGIASVNS